MPTLELLHTVDDEPFADLGELGRWRLMPHLGGVSFDRLQSLEQARSAGALVGRFHAALADFRRPLAPLGIPYRDTPRYLESLRNALETRSEHRLAAEMTPLGRRVLGAFEELGPPPESEARVIHGDLKLSNVLFEGDRPPERDRAFALVDLDTLMRAPLWVELGDAWRSWCNPAREETLEPRFDLDVFDASLEGFAEGLGGGVSRSERSSLVTAPERIALELCARYVTDAFEEVYWGWDESRYASRGDHNAARARGQWRLAEVMRGCREQRREILRRRL